MANRPSMNEQELLDDLLSQEKQMMSSYSTFLSEASCPNLRQILLNHFSQTSEDQFKVYEQMRQKGYYQPKDAVGQYVQQAKQKFEQMKTQLS